MIEFNKEGKLDISALRVQKPLPIDIIEEYDIKSIKKDFKRIVNQLMDNYFYQVSYQEFLKYEVTDDLQFIIIEDPNFEGRMFSEFSDLKTDFSFKFFDKYDYRKSITLCEHLLLRVKLAYENLDEIERFIIKNFEFDSNQEYVDESICYETGIHKDKYYISKKSAYIKLAIQLGLTIDEDNEKLLEEMIKKEILKHDFITMKV